MDTKVYFDEVMRKLENMSDEEFMELLEESGLENCPYVEENEVAKK